jgi:hypothetical protein
MNSGKKPNEPAAATPENARPSRQPRVARSRAASLDRLRPPADSAATRTKGSPVSAPDTTDRDEALLEHIGRYRLTLRAVLERVFEISSPGNVLQRLRKAELIVERSGLGPLSYYQLTPPAAAARSVPVDRTRPLSPSALGYHLAVLWFCCLERLRRHRLEPEQLRQLKLFAAHDPPSAQVAYCFDAERSAQPPHRRLWRVYAPGPTSEPSQVVRTLRNEIDAGTKRGDAAATVWLPGKLLGFAVLTDSEPRRRELHKALQHSGLFDEVHVALHLAPSPSTIAHYLKPAGGPNDAPR